MCSCRDRSTLPIPSVDYHASSGAQHQMELARLDELLTGRASIVHLKKASKDAEIDTHINGE